MDGLLYLLDITGRALAERDNQLAAAQRQIEVLKEEIGRQAVRDETSP